MNMHVKARIVLVGTIAVTLKLLFDLVLLPANYQDAAANAKWIQSEYSIDLGRAQLDGSRPARFRYKNGAGAKQLVPCTNGFCSAIPSLGIASVLHLEASLFVPTGVMLAANINGNIKTFNNAIADFRRRLLIVLTISIIANIFSYLFMRVNAK